MSNYKFKLLINPKEIYNNLIPKQREQFSKVEFTNTKLLPDGNVEIECLALESEVIEVGIRQLLELDKNLYITAKEI